VSLSLCAKSELGGDSSIAQISNTAGALGLVTGVSVGNTPITVTFNGIAGSTAVTASTETSNLDYYCRHGRFDR
jgi:hypothetical protein